MAIQEKQHYIYKILCVETGEYYYGKRSCEGRWQDDTKYMGSCPKLKNKMAAHPDYTWVKEVLLLLDSAEEAYEYEAVVVGERYSNGKDWDGLCLNLCAGGRNNADCVYTDETRAKMSDAEKEAAEAPAAEAQNLLEENI